MIKNDQVDKLKVPFGRFFTKNFLSDAMSRVFSPTGSVGRLPNFSITSGSNFTFFNLFWNKFLKIPRILRNFWIEFLD